MKTFEFQIYKKITKLVETQKSKKILFNLNISGGKDSMSLLHAFYQISCDKKNKIKDKYDYFVQHFDHKTRKGESKKDAEFVEEYCKNKDIPFFLSEYSLGDNKNFQSNARSWRKKEANNLSLKILSESSCDLYYIVTGHHLRDQVESVFLNILRGSGIGGLRGMRDFDSSYHVFRPLLDCSYEELSLYALESSVVFREDRSNKETSYSRNYLRQKVLPLLFRINEAYERNVARLSHYIDSYLNKDERNLHGENYVLEIKEETELGEVYKYLKMQSHLKYDLNSNQVKNIIHEAKLMRKNHSQEKKILTLKSGQVVEIYSAFNKVFLLSQTSS